MSNRRPPQRGYTRYRDHSAVLRRKQLARRRLLALVVFLVVVAAIVAGALALLGGGKGGTGSQTGAATHSSAPPSSHSSSSPSSSPSSSASAAAEKTVITIGWVGDTTPGSKYGMPPDGGRALFANLRSQLSAPDLMMANCEGTYSTATTSKGSGPNTFAFQAPPSYAQALKWAGIDLVSIANNHSHDFLQAGLQQTQAALKAAGIRYAGIPENTPIVTVKGVRVAVLAFSPYPWNNNINNIPAAVDLVRTVAGSADLVIVLMHAGAEGSDKTHTPHGSEFAFGENRGDSRAFAHAVIDAGADLVLGSGPHVIRGIERYKHRLIAYSLGNFAGWGNFGTGGTLSLSGLLTVKIDGAGRIHGGRWLSLYISGAGVPGVDANNTAAHLVSQLSAADFSATYKLSTDGSFRGD
jgi:Bacterial capsule synthesis protein PGA_cap